MRPLRILAIVLLVVGIVWIGQGLNVIKGSAMTGSNFWAVAGVALVIAAGVILFRDRRPATRR
jgi:glucose dehydrogenase